MKRKLDGLVAYHSLMTSRAPAGLHRLRRDERKAFEPVPQVLARRLPDSGRMSLYVASHAGTIRGMDDKEARQLIDELIAHGSQRQFVHSHRWRVNDLVIWDDRCTMHRGMDFDDQRYKRDMRRATVSDVAPTCEQMGLAAAAE
jgi:alpha-ketoglutarate-dependent 2,4-dichlorophenoxyacetate dioxygenase